MATSKRTVVKNRVTKSPRNRDAKKDAPTIAAFKNGVDSVVRGEFAKTISLNEFRSSASSSLSRDDRLLLIDQSLVLIDENYVHLPLKKAMHATDPVQSLKLLRYQVENDQVELDDLEFHRRMTSIFTSVRDLHTNYILPNPYRGMVAFVPFMIEEFSEGGQKRYLVTNVSEGFDFPPFESGIEITSWNGIDIARAVEIQGDRYAGSNMEARRARGVATLTVRQLALSLPPEEEFVIVGFLDSNGDPRELRTEWLVISAPVVAGEILPPSPRDARVYASMGMDMEMMAVQHVQKLLYAKQAVEDEARIARMSASTESAKSKSRSGQFAEFMPKSVMEGREIDTASGKLGYIRIRSFSYRNELLSGDQIIQSYVDKFLELAEALPQNGLIVDVRGNGGGYVLAGERLLQLMTPKTIHPEPTQFISTALNLAICKEHGFLKEWVDSLNDAVITGSQYSRGFPLTSPEEANDVGQRYFGPVTLITDALCYSTTDIFAAGFQDHGIGPIIGVHNNTGAGGANVWTHDLLQQLYPPGVGGSPYQELPNQAGMRVSIRRSMRVLDNAGTPVEDLGVVPDHLRELTRKDLLEGNQDLVDFAASILNGMPIRRLQIKAVNQSSGELSLSIETLGLSGCDVFADGRAHGSVEISDGQTDLSIQGNGFSSVELKGFDGNEIVAVRKIVV